MKAVVPLRARQAPHRNLWPWGILTQNSECRQAARCSSGVADAPSAAQRASCLERSSVCRSALARSWLSFSSCFAASLACLRAVSAASHLSRSSRYLSRCSALLFSASFSSRWRYASGLSLLEKGDW